MANPQGKNEETPANLFGLNLKARFGYTFNLNLSDLLHKRKGLALGYLPNELNIKS